MPSTREEFWKAASYAVIGDSRGSRGFPKRTCENLKKLGKTVYAVDPGRAAAPAEGMYPDLEGLPGPVEAAVLEVDKAQSAGWVQRVADEGISDLWIHQQTDTPEALRLAKESGLRTEHGTCAVMHTLQGFHGHHSCHRWLNKLAKKY